MADVIATGPCYYPPDSHVLAANKGDTVPAELAEKYGWPVARPGTKKAAEATEAE